MSEHSGTANGAHGANGANGVNGTSPNGAARRPASLTLVPVATSKQTTKEFKSDQEVRWCPGCG
ncbi:MAG: 2-oxoacid:ferredoxin oxidoreductase subunit beta, partial [Actinomycetota bacterium]